jgi:DNA-directed RNA polymerase specialized sigma24 family protein
MEASYRPMVYADYDRLRLAALAGAKLGGASAAAEDVAQEALISFLVTRHHVTSPETFVYRKAVWLAKDWRRNHTSRRRREDAWAGTRPRVAFGGPGAGLAVEALPGELRPIALLLAAGWSFAEIARALRLTKATVQRRVRIIRRLLAA